MAEFQKVMQERQRMCNSYRSCCQCRINAVLNDICTVWITKNPEEAERIIMKWAAEHPIMTNARKFEEVFGFSFYYRFGGSEVDTAWLAEEYKGGQDDG